MFHVMSFGFLRWIRESASASASPPASTIERTSLSPFEHTGAPVSRLLLPQHPGQRMHASGHICVSGCARLILVLCPPAGLSHDLVAALPPENPHHQCHDQAPLQDQQVSGPVQRPRKASARQRHPHHGLLLRVLQTPPQVPERTEGMVLPFIPPRCLELFAPGLIEHKPELVRGLVDGLVAFLRCKFFTDQ